MIERDNDVVFSVVPGQQYADYRLLARDNVPIAFFVKHPNAGFHDLATVSRMATPRPFLVQSAAFSSMMARWFRALKANNQAPYVPATSQSAVVTGNVLGDWDNGLACVPDGPYIGRLDQGNVWSINSRVPYFENNWSYAPPAQSLVRLIVKSPRRFHSAPCQQVLYRKNHGEPCSFAPVRMAILVRLGSPSVGLPRTTSCLTCSGCRWSNPMELAIRLRPLER